MCGIVGVVGDLGSDEEKAFTYMLKVDTVRGQDSTGVVAVHPNKDIIYDKEVGTAFDFLEYGGTMFRYTGEYKYACRALIGHNRAATLGGVNEENAHPFDFPNVIGVHNGTLRSQSWELEGFNTYDCDSESLYDTIDKHGLRDAISKTEGAYSLAYWDKQDECVVLLRNKERPMVYRVTADGSCVFFASESWMIAVACAKYGVKLRGNYKAIATQPHKKYKIYPFRRNKKNKEMLFLKEKEKVEAKKYTAPVTKKTGAGVVGRIIRDHRVMENHATELNLIKPLLGSYNGRFLVRFIGRRMSRIYGLLMIGSQCIHWMGRILSELTLQLVIIGALILWLLDILINVGL